MIKKKKMSCKNCGKSDNPSESNYCNRCGVVLERYGDCAVCLQDNVLLKPLSCGHSFCQNHCYSRCCKKCPVCRKANTFMEGTTTPNILKNACPRCNCTELRPKAHHLKCGNCAHEFLESSAKKMAITELLPVIPNEQFPVRVPHMCNKCSWISWCPNIDNVKCGGCKSILDQQSATVLSV